MSKVNVTPTAMDRICNIQAMREKIIPGYDRFADFNSLAKLTEDQLWDLQNALIPDYNNTLKSQG
jgi:hypothetical protein